MSRQPTCHPERRYGAHGLCRACYMRGWKRGLYTVPVNAKRSCRLCAAPFVPVYGHQEHCSAGCRRRQRSLARSRREGEELTVTRSRRIAEDLARAYAERGCRVLSRRAAIDKLIDTPAWVKAWRSGDLYIVRARLPVEYQEAA